MGPGRSIRQRYLRWFEMLLRASVVILYLKVPGIIKYVYRYISRYGKRPICKILTHSVTVEEQNPMRFPRIFHYQIKRMRSIEIHLNSKKRCLYKEKGLEMITLIFVSRTLSVGGWSLLKTEKDCHLVFNFKFVLCSPMP